jgi:putative membrane protein
MSRLLIRSPYALLFTLPLALAACAHNRGGGATAGMSGASAMAGGNLSDAQIAGVLDAVNLGEVQQAHLAQEKATEPAVRNYANAMMNGHQAAARQQAEVLDQRGIAPQETDLSRQLRQQSQQEEQRLSQLEGPAFDRAYIQAQIRSHQDALNLIDQQLLPNASDPAYRAYLEQLRGHLQQHLSQAQQVQSAAMG